MATIIEGALWTVTEEVAEHMVDIGLLQKCQNNHTGMLDHDKPIYHISCNAPQWFGFATIDGTIRQVEKNLGQKVD